MIDVAIAGTLTRNPEIATTPNGKTVCKFNIVSKDRFVKDKAHFINVQAWGQLGENCYKFLGKGKKVAVRASSIMCNAWIGKDEKAKGAITINADEVEFLSPRGSSESLQVEEKTDDTAGFTDITVDDIPF